MAYVIGEACVDVKDRQCVEECPVDCIYEGDRKLYINPTECIDCGMCKAVCPTAAITSDIRTPESLLAYIADNARFFAEPLPGRTEPVGTPGGAEDFGATGVDTEFVAALPRRDGD
ncbi:ferredoxin [Actinacidiphila glaucinigra]|uniref:ferredoxin n=1 Tax=Actinacidiphila glaucinigra TaxID=235986 RepID=UPI0035DF145C